MLIGLSTNRIIKFIYTNSTRCISLNNHQCMIQPTLINLHPNDYSQGLH